MHPTGSNGLELPSDKDSIAMFDIPSRLTIEPRIHQWHTGLRFMLSLLQPVQMAT
jgi:hypothetical protein